MTEVPSDPLMAEGRPVEPGPLRRLRHESEPEQVERVLTSFEDGRFLIDRMGAESTVDPDLAIVLLDLRRRLRDEHGTGPAAMPGEEAALGAARRQGLWHNWRDPRTFAREDLVAVEVAAVGQGGDLVAARGLLCLERHGRKLLAVVPLISHLVRHDQMVLRVDGDLHV